MDKKRNSYSDGKIKNVHPTELRRNGKKSAGLDNIRIQSVDTNKSVSPKNGYVASKSGNEFVGKTAKKNESPSVRPRQQEKSNVNNPALKNVKYITTSEAHGKLRADYPENTSYKKVQGEHGNAVNRKRPAVISPEREKEIYARNFLNLILCAVFAFMILGMGFFVMVHMLNGNKPTYSEFEKRNLESAPELSLESLSDGSYTENFDKFFSDNFPMREMLVEKATELKRYRGIRAFKKDANQVIGGDTDIYSDGNLEINIDENKFANAEAIVIPGLDSDSETPENTDFVPGATAQGGDVQVPASAESEESADSANASAGTVTDNTETGSSTSAGEAVDVGTPKGEKRDAIYLIGDTAYEYFKGTEKSASDYVSVINAYAKYIPSNVNIYTLVIPTHPEFGLEGVDRTVSNDQKPIIEYIGRNLDKKIRYVNPYDKLYSAYKSGEYLYFRTDHHWTIRGAYLAYKEFCETANITPVPSENYEIGRIEPFLGTFYSAANRDTGLKENPDYVEFFKITTPCTVTRYDAKGESSTGALYYRRVNGEANGYLAFMGGDFPYVNIKTENTNGKVLMIFKESFGNPLIGLLAPHYSEIHVADIRYFRYNAINFIKQYGVTDVLFCNGIMSANSSARVNDMLELMNK